MTGINDALPRNRDRPDTKKPRFREAAGRSASTARTHHEKTYDPFLKPDQDNPIPRQ
jgi:hypothetical protein